MLLINKQFHRKLPHVGVSAVALSAAFLVAPGSAGAQAPQTPSAGSSHQDTTSTTMPSQGLQDIVVTAERQASNAQKVAAAVTVQRGTDLLERGKFTLRNILETVPGVSGGESEGTSNEPTGNDSPAAGITIRGISSNGGVSGQTLSGVPAVAIYADDVYNGIGGSYDIDRVEVLRGPQGTLYGRSATAGVVAIHTRNPDLRDFTLEESLEGGSYDLIHATAAANVPLISDKLAVRAAVNQYQRDGVDVDNGVGKSNVTEGKVKILLEPTDRFSLLVGGAFQDRTLYNGGVAGNFVAPDTIVYSPYSVGDAKLKSRQAWAEANLDLGFAHLTYLPAYRTFTQVANIFVVGPGGNAIKQIVNTPHDIFLTQELRLSSQAESPIKWQTGLFYYYNNIRSDNRNVWESSNGLLFDGDIKRRTRDLGVFAEATIPLTDALRITGGLRYDKTTINTSELYTSNLNVFCNTPLGFITGCAVGSPNSPVAGLPENTTTFDLSGEAGHKTFKNVTYKARLEYDVSPTNMLYASVSTAFLPGDVQVGTGAGNLPAAFPYKAEQLTAYEIGSKNRFFNRRLQVNADIFHYDYAGYQTIIQTDLANPATAILFNAPLRLNGVELEAIYQLTQADRVGLNFSHIHSKFHNLPAEFADNVAQRSLWGFSPTTVTLYYDREFELPGGSTLAFHGEGIWRAAYDVLFTSPSLAAEGGLDYEHQKSFVQGNLSLTWSSPNKRYSLTGYVRNVGDTRYKTYVNLQSITPLQASGTVSDPRTFGAVLAVKF